MDGNETTDAGVALTGLIQPIGAHKGVGLGMAVGILSSLLAGGGYGTESGTMETGARTGADGQMFIAINIAAFTDSGEFATRMDRIVAQVHGSRRRDGVERLRVPGEIEADFERDYDRDGILLAGATLDDIRASAEALGVDAGRLGDG